MKRVVVIGAGSWGSAISLVLASKGLDVTIWDRDEKRANLLETTRKNEKYLKDITFPSNIKITSSTKDLLKDAKFIVFSVPAQALRSVISKFSNDITEDMIIINTAKGIELTTGMRLSQVIKDEIKGKYHKNICVLSGPTHAEEVALSYPTAIVAAGDEKVAKKVQELFSTPTFRVYVNEDIAGCEICGALKNIMAIGAGVIDGIGYGDNTKAALMTRGLQEIKLFGMKKSNAKSETFDGLSGMGDLIVTCNSQHSRNRHVGDSLGRGQKLDDIIKSMNMVAEGVATTRAVYEIIKDENIDMPITRAIYKVLFENETPNDMIEVLMTRKLKNENIIL